MRIELRLPASTSLKDKRQTLRHLLDAARRRYNVAAAELEFQDLRQRALLGFAAVAESPQHVEDVLAGVERFIWSHPEFDVVASDREWTEAID
jgi:uncharacterized protein YlxP (DUF503 family)